MTIDIGKETSITIDGHSYPDGHEAHETNRAMHFFDGVNTLGTDAQFTVRLTPPHLFVHLVDGEPHDLVLGFAGMTLLNRVVFHLPTTGEVVVGTLAPGSTAGAWT